MPDLNELIATELTDNWRAFRDINGLAGHNATLDSVMIFSGDWLIFLLPALALSLWLLVARWSPFMRRMRLRFGPRLADHGRRTIQRTTLTAALAVAAGLGLAFLVSSAIFEPRPFVASPGTVHLLIAHATDDSFPSDHETVAAAIAFPLAFGAFALFWTSLREPLVGVAAGWSWNRAFRFVLVPAAIAAIALLCAALVGFARVYDGVHYPHDIAGGAACGLIGSLVALALSRPLDAGYRLIVRIAEFMRLA
ncbi:MAG TPA: phosphatase PAP2 family protein [Ktedonobacterales bacterium]